jgi:hypothetical protein
MRISTDGGKKLLLSAGLLMFIFMPTIVSLSLPQSAQAGSLKIVSQEGETDSSYRGSGR